MDFVEFLEKRLVELEQDRVAAIESMAVVREKIKDADAKRGTQPGTEHYHKWSTILKGLERDLDKVRSVVVAREAEIEQKQKKLVQIREQAAEDAQRGADISKKIMEMSDEELANLTLEDIALLQEYELSLAAMEKENATDQPSAPVEKHDTPVAVQPPQAQAEHPAEPKATHGPSPAVPEPDGAKPSTPSRGHVLGKAMREFAHNVENVTLAEVHAVIDGYASLREAPNLDAEKQRLRDALSVAVDKARKEIGRIWVKLDYLEKHSKP